MSLTDKINADIKAAMLAKEKEKLDALRAIKAGILLAQTSGEAVTPESEIKMLQKMVKQRRESAEIYKTQNREDLVKIELDQAAVIETYLPAQMSKDEITVVVKNIIAQTGATSAKDMGKVMGVAAKELAGKADNKIVSTIVKELLNS
jgi:uncharacterized protein